MLFQNLFFFTKSCLKIRAVFDVNLANDDFGIEFTTVQISVLSYGILRYMVCILDTSDVCSNTTIIHVKNINDVRPDQKIGMQSTVFSSFNMTLSYSRFVAMRKIVFIIHFNSRPMSQHTSYVKGRDITSHCIEQKIYRTYKLLYVRNIGLRSYKHGYTIMD